MKPQSDFQPENSVNITWTGTLAEDIKIGTGRGGMLEVFGGSGAKLILQGMNDKAGDQAIEYDSILPDFYQSNRIAKIKAGSTFPDKIVMHF